LIFERNVKVAQEKSAKSPNYATAKSNNPSPVKKPNMLQTSGKQKSCYYFLFMFCLAAVVASTTLKQRFWSIFPQEKISELCLLNV